MGTRKQTLLKRLVEIRNALPHYFGAQPNGEGAQDCFDREFDALMDEEAEVMAELEALKIMSDEIQEYAKRVNYERAQWRQLREVYRRCVAIAEDVWAEKLDQAQAEQILLAEEMRDRAEAIETPQTVTTDPRYMVKGGAEVFTPPVTQWIPREIPVPLFTPRDRLQFIKEVTVALLIEAGKRSLPATPEGAREESPIDTEAVVS